MALERTFSGLTEAVTEFKLPTGVEAGYTFHIVPDSSHSRRAKPKREYWRREASLGRGAFGSVFKERLVSQGHGPPKFRAVKQIDLLTGPSATGIDYGRELEAIAKFSHPKYERCFVKASGWYGGPEVGSLFIAMEYLEYGDLQSYLWNAATLPEHEACEISFQLLEGLEFMHNNGFAHRDLKPANILIKSEPPNQWWVKISDFGISKRIADGKGISSILAGTVAFFSPEVLDAGKTPSYDAYSADMWALGEIAHQMLTKEAVFDRPSTKLEYGRGDVEYPNDRLMAYQVSNHGQSFIVSVMHPFPTKRLKVDQALSHDWIRPFADIDSDFMPLESVQSLTLLDTPNTSEEVSPESSGRWSTIAKAKSLHERSQYFPFDQQLSTRSGSSSGRGTKEIRIGGSSPPPVSEENEDLLIHLGDDNVDQKPTTGAPTKEYSHELQELCDNSFKTSRDARALREEQFKFGANNDSLGIGSSPPMPNAPPPVPPLPTANPLEERDMARSNFQSAVLRREVEPFEELENPYGPLESQVHEANDERPKQEPRVEGQAARVQEDAHEILMAELAATKSTRTGNKIDRISSEPTLQTSKHVPEATAEIESTKSPTRNMPTESPVHRVSDSVSSEGRSIRSEPVARGESPPYFPSKTTSGPNKGKSNVSSNRDIQSIPPQRILNVVASIRPFDPEKRSHRGVPFLKHQAGEIFDIFGEQDDLWLARNQDCKERLGWIWQRNCLVIPSQDPNVDGENSPERNKIPSPSTLSNDKIKAASQGIRANKELGPIVTAADEEEETGDDRMAKLAAISRDLVPGSPLERSNSKTEGSSSTLSLPIKRLPPVPKGSTPGEDQDTFPRPVQQRDLDAQNSWRNHEQNILTPFHEEHGARRDICRVIDVAELKSSWVEQKGNDAYSFYWSNGLLVPGTSTVIARSGQRIARHCHPSLLIVRATGARAARVARTTALNFATAHQVIIYRSIEIGFAQYATGLQWTSTETLYSDLEPEKTERSFIWHKQEYLQASQIVLSRSFSLAAFAQELPGEVRLTIWGLPTEHICTLEFQPATAGDSSKDVKLKLLAFSENDGSALAGVFHIPETDEDGLGQTQLAVWFNEQQSVDATEFATSGCTVIKLDPDSNVKQLELSPKGHQVAVCGPSYSGVYNVPSGDRVWHWNTFMTSFNFAPTTDLSNHITVTRPYIKIIRAGKRVAEWRIDPEEHISASAVSFDGNIFAVAWRRGCKNDYNGTGCLRVWIKGKFHDPRDSVSEPIVAMEFEPHSYKLLVCLATKHMAKIDLRDLKPGKVRASIQKIFSF